MVERSTISQVVQLGVETTPGTAVAATKRLTSLSIEPTINANVNRFRPQGSKYETVAALGKEWTTAPVTGIATYDEIIYPLSSVLTAGTHTTIASNGGEKWEFAPSTYAADTPKTYTIEYGSAQRAHKLTYGLFQEFGIDINRDAVNLSGALMGQRITDAITLTASPTSIPLVPMLPTSFDVYVDPLFDDIGTTKLGRLLSCNWRIGSRSNPLWVVDSSKTSWVAHVETVPTLELEMVMEADAAGMAYLNTLRAGTALFTRIKSIGGPLGGTYVGNYDFELDLAVHVVGTGGFSDQEGVYAITWQLAGSHDDDLGGAVKATVINTRTAL